MNNKMRKHDDDSRCPLAGAAKAVCMIPDAAMLIVGTEECAYYTKSMMEMKFGGDNIFSVILDKNDITFGSIDKVEVAIDELATEYSHKAIYLTTTCVVEVIGDDFTALVQEMSVKHGIDVHLISTNHFSGESAHDGTEKVFAVSGTDMGSEKFSMMKSMMKMKMGGRH